MKKIIFSIISIIAVLILLGEPEEITIVNISLKIISLIWFWLLAKANNYFYERN